MAKWGIVGWKDSSILLISLKPFLKDQIDERVMKVEDGVISCWRNITHVTSHIYMNLVMKGVNVWQSISSPAKPSKMFLKLQLVSALWGGRSNVSNFRAKLTSSKVGKVVANPLASRPFLSLEFKLSSDDFSSEELHIRVRPRVCSSVQMTLQDVKYFPVTLPVVTLVAPRCFSVQIVQVSLFSVHFQ